MKAVFKRLVLSLVPFLCGLLVLSAHSVSAHATERLMVTGSSSIAPIALEIVKRFESERPDVQIDIQTGGSSRGIHDARKGLADIGMVSRSLGPDEKDLIGHTIALDAVTMITHAKNPILGLDRSQIVDIYTNKIDDWSQLEDFKGPIVVVNKADGRSTLEVFLQYTQLQSSSIEPDIIIGDNEQAIKTVSTNPLAIAYVSVGASTYHIENGLPLRMIAVDGVIPNAKSLAAGSLPMIRELNFVTAGKPEGLTAEFIAFATSPSVVDILEAFYVLPPAQ